MFSMQGKGIIGTEVKKVIEEYNRNSRILTIGLYFIGLVGDYDDNTGMEDIATELYKIATIEMIKAAYGLEMVVDGEVFFDKDNIEVEIEEDWVLESIEMGENTIIPRGLVSLPDSPLTDCLKYDKITLRYKPNLKLIYPKKNYPGYAVDLPDSYPMRLKNFIPQTSLAANSGIGIFVADYNGFPAPHLRYKVTLLGMPCLANDENSLQVEMTMPVYDAFVYNGNEHIWESRGINDNWYESYQYIAVRLSNFPLKNRVIRWCNFFGFDITVEASVQPIFDRIRLNGWLLPTNDIPIIGLRGLPSLHSGIFIPITEGILPYSVGNPLIIGEKEMV